MKTFAARMFLILLLATVAIQVLSFGGVLVGTGRAERQKLFDYLGHDAALMHRLLLKTPLVERADWLPWLNRGYYELRLQPTSLQNTIVHDASLDAAAAPVRAQLGPAVQVQTVIVGYTDEHLPGIEVPLDSVQKLLILFPTREPPYPAPSLKIILAYLAFVTLAVVAVAWVAMRLVMRPLRYGARATQALAANLDAPPIPERGPSELVGVARAFNTMQRAIRKHLDERTQILASISHDLKTPLTRLRLRVAELDADERRARIEADIDVMKGVIQDGLDYAHSGQLREPIVPVDLNALVESIAERSTDAGQDVRVEGRVDAAVPCAPRALERALQNLVDNAVQYGERARICLHDAGAKVEICVEDDGPGLPDDLLNKVFEPFYRAEASRSRRTGGTGLGLAIALNLVRSQGGEIRLENRKPRGLAACVSLRRAGARSAFNG